MAERTRNPGFELKPGAASASSTAKCDDPNCPYHGSLKLRGKRFTGLVKSTKMQRSALVEWKNLRFIPKFERYRKTKTKICVHNPVCINAKEGDNVEIMECKPLSKTKNFVIVNIVGKEKTFELEQSLEEEGKHKESKKIEARKKVEKEKTEEESS